MNDPCKIFISYCDERIAEFLYLKLKHNEFVAWIDDEQVFKQAGKKFNPAIFKAIEEAAYFVILLSQDSLQNPYVMDELTAAYKMSKKPGREDFIQYLILDEKTYSNGIALAEDEIVSFKDWNEGVQAFLYFRDKGKAISQLLTFLSIKLNKPIYVEEVNHGLMMEYRFQVGEEVRTVRFITAFLFDVIYELGRFKNVKIRVNPFAFKKKYRYTVEGTYYRINFAVTFNRLFGTITNIEQEIKYTMP